jgi:4-azaleucine resistance transporter AzlC
MVLIEMRIPTEFMYGLRSSIPIILAYVPIALAFGAAASGVGFSPKESALMSALMVSGSHQALFVSGIASGMALILLVVLCAIASLRHLFYGFILRDHINSSRLHRLIYSYVLTDEVFAMTLIETKRRQTSLPGAWLIGLVLATWSCWVCGTFIGALAGQNLMAMSSEIAKALEFALPALFIALVWLSVNQRMVRPMLIAITISGACMMVGFTDFAIPAGALAAFTNKRIS